MADETLTNPHSISEHDAREKVCELCVHFYKLGWASGTGGGVSIRSGDKIVMAPSGVQKERMQPSDMFLLDLEGSVLEAPEESYQVSACKPLFMHAFKHREAGAVLHSHSMNAMLATLIFDKAFKISNIEMMKGIEGVGVFDTHEVPIIDNTAHESDLADSLEKAVLDYLKSNAVLVRGHGVYVWGRDWIQAKTQAECYDYLFQAAVEMKKLGLDPEKGGKQ